MGTAYFLGFFGGCIATSRLIVRAGHIRVFAALCALAAIGSLGFVLVIDVYVWIVIRCLTGFCFSGLSMVVESWLNERAASSDRARVLSLYRIVDLGAVTAVSFFCRLLASMIFTFSRWLPCCSRQRWYPSACPAAHHRHHPRGPGSARGWVWRLSRSLPRAV